MLYYLDIAACKSNISQDFAQPSDPVYNLGNIKIKRKNQMWFLFYQQFQHEKKAFFHSSDFNHTNVETTSNVEPHRKSSRQKNKWFLPLRQLFKQLF